MLIKNDDKPSGLGYYLIDQRASGIPVFGGNAVFEADTYTCTHCNRVVVLHPMRTRPRYKCRGCSHLICDDCAVEREAGVPCKTMAQKVDEILADAERQAAGQSLVLPQVKDIPHG